MLLEVRLIWLCETGFENTSEDTLKWFPFADKEGKFKGIETLNRIFK